MGGSVAFSGSRLTFGTDEYAARCVSEAGGAEGEEKQD